MIEIATRSAPTPMTGSALRAVTLHHVSSGESLSVRDTSIRLPGTAAIPLRMKPMAFGMNRTA